MDLAIPDHNNSYEAHRHQNGVGATRHQPSETIPMYCLPPPPTPPPPSFFFPLTTVLDRRHCGRGQICHHTSLVWGNLPASCNEGKARISH